MNGFKGSTKNRCQKEEGLWATENVIKPGWGQLLEVYTRQQHKLSSHTCRVGSVSRASRVWEASRLCASQNKRCRHSTCKQTKKKCMLTSEKKISLQKRSAADNDLGPNSGRGTAQTHTHACSAFGTFRIYDHKKECVKQPSKGGGALTKTISMYWCKIEKKMCPFLQFGLSTNLKLGLYGWGGGGALTH